MTATVTPGEKPARRARTVLIGLGILLVGATAVSCWATQFVARHFSYHPALGRPWFGHVYAPWAWFRWQMRFYEQGRDLFNVVYVVFLAAVGLVLVAYVLFYGFRSRRSVAHPDVHGTAHFASTEEVAATGLLDPDSKGGVYIGGWKDEKSDIHYLRHDGPEHILLAAPTRSGKGITCVVPTLLAWSHSLLVYDPKSELWNLTAGWRQKHAKNKVLKFEPGSAEGSARWNALADMPLGNELDVSFAQQIAQMVTDPDGKGLEDHWAKTSAALCTGLILHVAYRARSKGQVASLPDVADTLSDPSRPLEKLWEEMVENTHLDGQQHLTVASTGRDMLNTPEKERGSTVSTLRSNLAIYRDPIVSRNCRTSDFTASDLMDYETPVSVYLSVNPGNKDRLRPVIRLLINQVIRTLVSVPIEFEGGKQKAPHKHRLLALMDEFPALGKLPIMAESLAYIAGYGIKAFIITQDVVQLWEHYSKQESIISNCHIRAFFAPNNPETAEWLSKLLGTGTVVTKQTSTSGKRFGAVLEQVSTSVHEVARPLLTADECQRLPGPKKDSKGRVLEPGEMLICVSGHAPIRGHQTPYFLNSVFSERIKIPAPPTDRIDSSRFLTPEQTKERFELA